MAVRILIADDDELIRESLKIILGAEKDFVISDCVENGLKAVQICSLHQIDVALLDVKMPVMNGVQATKEICKNTKTKPLILTTFDDDEYIIDAIKFGAKGYLLKNNPPEKIKDAIKAVHYGNSVIQEAVLEKLKGNLVQDTRSKTISKGLFTEREYEIIELVSEGLSNKKIAESLYISEGTVKNYITSILSKTGLEHRTQIAITFINGRS